MTTMNSQILLVSRPSGEAVAENFRLIEAPLPALRDGQVLSVEVADDGVGGANPNGGGLSGLRRRIEALDGTLRVASPSGGPTVVRAEMPCG